MTGIVLSGGENRRMGRDKAFLKIAGIPMIEHVLQALQSVVKQKIIIVTNSPQAYTSYGVRVVTDASDKRGSLIGIYTGLLYSQDEYNIVVACDMPFLNPGLISYMAGLAEGYDIVVPKIGEFIEPLHAVYCRALLPVIENRIQLDDRQLKGMLHKTYTRYVTEAEIDRFDPQRRSFKNINTQQEYQEATCSDLECQS